MKKHLSARLAAIGAAALLAISGAALAEPGHGHRGPHGGGDDVAMAIAALKGQLNLNTSQQQMWDNAVAASKAAHQNMRANMQRVHDALAAELAKAEPDLAAVAAVGDQVQAQNVALRHQARDAWLAVYATFTPDQKAVVKSTLQKRLARAEAMRQKHMQAEPQS
ncbi:MAG TPA: periplasmic heavy metal sensor [Casimicrobiaceae bacterium]|jgi:Spy/CpxP family protein refolding chaperone